MSAFLTLKISLPQFYSISKYVIKYGGIKIKKFIYLLNTDWGLMVVTGEGHVSLPVGMLSSSRENMGTENTSVGANTIKHKSTGGQGNSLENLKEKWCLELHLNPGPGFHSADLGVGGKATPSGGNSLN